MYSNNAFHIQPPESFQKFTGFSILLLQRADHCLVCITRHKLKTLTQSTSHDNYSCFLKYNISFRGNPIFLLNISIDRIAWITEHTAPSLHTFSHLSLLPAGKGLGGATIFHPIRLATKSSPV